MKRFKTLKSYTLYTLLGTVFLCSCTGVETPNFNDKPFIVGSVERYNDSLCIYTATNFTAKFSELFAGKQRFIAKEKLFQVGDTVRISKRSTYKNRRVWMRGNSEGIYKLTKHEITTE